MTEKERQLILQDLCARIPYGVKILHQGWNYEWDQELSTVEKVTGIDEKFIYTKVIDNNGKEYTSDKHTISLFEDKPYLYPMSSMSEEQQIIYGDLCYQIINATPFEIQKCIDELYDWLNENYFDHRGLIPKGLAKDATGLNIY